MFSQCFGDSREANTEADNVSALAFDRSGKYLATGDNAGRIVLFNKNDVGKQPAERLDRDEDDHEWTVHHQFQSHDQEFDYLKSLEIEEKINCIEWCYPRGSKLSLLSANDKSVKLWKVSDRKTKVSGKKFSSIKDGVLSISSRPQYQMFRYAASKHVYNNAHSYHINSVSVNSDCESFLSADDLRINWWNMETPDTCFNVVDIKPNNMEELTEVITAAKFHPEQCNIMAYSSSRGMIKIVDTRASAICDRCSRVFEEPEDPNNRTFFTEIIASISDFSFGDGGRYIVSRDYLSLKIWDLYMESRPIKVINIHTHLNNLLCELYEADQLFDKFRVAASPDFKHLFSGGYGNRAFAWDQTGELKARIELPISPAVRPRPGETALRSAPVLTPELAELKVDKKILHCAWSPDSNTVAMSAQACLYLYKI